MLLEQWGEKTGEMTGSGETERRETVTDAKRSQALDGLQGHSPHQSRAALPMGQEPGTHLA